MTLAIVEAALLEADFALEIFADLKAAEAVGRRWLLVVLLVWSWAAFGPFEAAEAEVAVVVASVLTLELALSTLLEPEIEVLDFKLYIKLALNWVDGFRNWQFWSQNPIT